MSLSGRSSRSRSAAAARRRRRRFGRLGDARALQKRGARARLKRQYLDFAV
jgi:hypothetical protein